MDEDSNKGIFDENTFLAQINGKNHHAFHKLFRDFYKSLVYFSLQYVGRLDVAEDLVQDFFTRLWERDAQYESYEGFKTFMYTAIRNASLNWLKHVDVERKFAQHSLHDHSGGEVEDIRMMEEEIFRKLMKSVEELPPRCKEIFKLCLRGAKNEEIARQLDLSIETVKTQKKKAVRLLKEKVGNLYWLLFLFYDIL